MPRRRSTLVSILCLSFAVAGCGGKGGMDHVTVETTDFAAERGLTIDDWGWSGDTFTAKFAATEDFEGTWILYVQAFDADGERLGREVQFLSTVPVDAGETSWVEVPDVKLRDETHRVVFDIQTSLVPHRMPHYDE